MQSHAERGNEVLAIQEGFLYLAVFTDMYSRTVVGLLMSSRFARFSGEQCIDNSRQKTAACCGSFPAITGAA